MEGGYQNVTGGGGGARGRAANIRHERKTHLLAVNSSPCRIRVYVVRVNVVRLNVTFGYMSFGLMLFGLLSFGFMSFGILSKLYLLKVGLCKCVHYLARFELLTPKPQLGTHTIELPYRYICVLNNETNKK